MLRLASPAILTLVLASVHPAGANEEIPFTPEQLAAAQTNYVDFCSDCHATNGSGAIGPGIRGSGALADAQYVLRQIAQGSGEMPGFGSVLSDEEILGLANYVRNNLGNSFGYITVEEAASAAQ